MTADSSREPDDPLNGASEAFQEHEKELFDEALARIQRDIPKEATVEEALAEMRRAMLEEDDAQKLLFRIAVLQHGGSGYIRARLEDLAAEESEDLHVQYTSAPMSQEALALMMRLGAEIEKRLPSDLSEAEREARVVELLQEDEELAELAWRLERLLPPPKPTGEDEPL